jgi:hypothetical protein
MLVLDQAVHVCLYFRLCHPRAFPPFKKKPETHKQAGKPNQLQHRETHAQVKAEGQMDRAASCDGNKPHQNQQHPIRVHCTRMQVSALTAKSDSRGP